MRQALLNLSIIILGFIAVFGLSRFINANQAPLPPEIAEADLAFKSDTLKKYSLGFDGLIADYYWISSLQYIGRKIIEKNGLANIQIDDLTPLNPRLLYPLLDTAITLDPEFSAAYSYGATVLPAVNVEQAIKFIEKGIAAQPDNWRLYHQLGYIYWKNENYQKASAIYVEGAAKPNAAPFMKQIGAILAAEGSSRNTARIIYRQLYENADDNQTKDIALRRLMQVDSFDELDVLRSALRQFQAQNNRCIAGWHELFPLIRTARLPNGKGLRFTQSLEPIDPSDTPYHLLSKPDKCQVVIDSQKSLVPPEKVVP